MLANNPQHKTPEFLIDNVLPGAGGITGIIELQTLIWQSCMRKKERDVPSLGEVKVENSGEKHSLIFPSGKIWTLSDLALNVLNLS